MARTALRSVGEAIEITRSFLLPVSIRRIAALAVAVLFMGTPGTPLPASPQFADPTLWRLSEPPESVGGGGGDWSVVDGSVELFDPGSWPPWLVAVVIAATFLALAYALLGVLMRFVLAEALRTDDVRIRHDARVHLGDALGVFVVRLVLWTITLAALAGTAVAVLDVGPWTVSSVVALGLGLSAAVVLVLAWAIEVLTLQFVIPTMIATDSGVLAGWRRFWPTLRADPIEYGLYGVVRVVLGVGIGIAAAIGVALALGLAAILLGTIAAIVVVLAGGLGSLGAVALAVLGALLLVFLLVAIVAGVVIAVPFQCYLWVYSLLVLGDLDPELDLLADRRATARRGASDAEPSA